MLELICQYLGVGIGEGWKSRSGDRFKIDEEEGLMYWSDSYEQWVTPLYASVYYKLLTGEIKPIWQPQCGEYYYVPKIAFDSEYRYRQKVWEGSPIDTWYLDRGMVCKSTRRAIELTNQMIEPFGDM